MTQVAIAVPVRNEGERLPRLLHALAGQAAVPPPAVTLFFDGCTDDGAAVAAEVAASLSLALHVVVAEGAGPPNAGLARGRACAAALSRHPDAILLTTDADSTPARDWIAASLAGLAAAEIVAGEVVADRGAEAATQRRLARYLDRLHRHRRSLDPVAWEDARTHHWTSAASLAFRPGVYQALGGFAPLPCGEDADLGDRAWRAGVSLRRDARVRVTTSARRGGRVVGGFAGLLAALDAADAAPTVAHPDDEDWRYRHHGWARRCWAEGVTAPLAHALGTERADLDRLVAATPNAEAFTARAVGAPPGGMRAVTLAEAETALDALDARMIETAA